ncbi:hypothetical protein Ancab_002309 [Ancistrocladus abbreviatus]
MRAPTGSKSHHCMVHFLSCPVRFEFPLLGLWPVSLSADHEGKMGGLAGLFLLGFRFHAVSDAVGSSHSSSFAGSFGCGVETAILVVEVVVVESSQEAVNISILSHRYLRFVWMVLGSKSMMNPSMMLGRPSRSAAKLSAADNLKRLGFTFVFKEVELPVSFDNAWITVTKSHFLGIFKKRNLWLAVLKRGAVLRSSTPYWDITK